MINEQQEQENSYHRDNHVLIAAGNLFEGNTPLHFHYRYCLERRLELRDVPHQEPAYTICSKTHFILIKADTRDGIPAALENDKQYWIAEREGIDTSNTESHRLIAEQLRYIDQIQCMLDGHHTMSDRTEPKADILTLASQKVGCPATAENTIYLRAASHGYTN